jgi:type VI secretion system protein ImpH
VLLALTGHGTAHLTNRMLIGTEPLLHYAGLFAMRPRSAERLGVLVSDWLGMRVEVIEFAGAWLSLPPDQRTRVGANGQFNRLSADAAAGVRAWDPQARIVLRVGPLDRAGFERMLPDRLALHRVVSLVRAYVGFEIGFAINPVLAAGAVPPLRLDQAADPPPRLGWNTWLEPVAGGQKRLHDAAEPVFEAEIIEAQTPVGAQSLAAKERAG